MKTKPFTLIEIIIGIVLLSTVAIAIGDFTYSMLKGVKKPEEVMTASMSLKKVCTAMRNDFKANFSSNIDNFRVKVGTGTQDNSYGKYTVIISSYVTFSETNDTYTETPTGTTTDYLKVKIKSNSSKESATMIFYAK